MGEDVEALKRRTPLIEYLRQHNWTGHPASRSEIVGLCPLHEETRPSFYVNTHKDVFYCHGCGRGGDLIRFVQLFGHLSFRQSLAHLDPQTAPAVDSSAALQMASDFYRQQLNRYPEAISYLGRRGLRAPELIGELEIGYAPGGSLRRHLTALGYSYDLLRQVGFLNANGSDAFYQRIVFPLRQSEHIVNLYGRSIGTTCAHRFLPGTKGGLYAWEKVPHCSEVILVEGLFDYAALRQAGHIVNLYGRSIGTAFPHRFLPGTKGGLYARDKARHYSEVILVEGLFDYAVLRQAGFHNVACSLGTHLNADQLLQLCEGLRTVYLAFDVDTNNSGQQAAQQLADRLHAHGIASRRALLPEGHDPNSFFVQGGDALQFHSLLKAAQP